MPVTEAERSDLIEEIMQHLRGQFAPATVGDDVQRLNGWRKKTMADGSFGRVFNGPQWLDGIAVRDETLTGKKLAAQLVISNLFTTVDETLTPLADRVNMDASGFRAYGTVSGTPNTKTLDIQADGDFTFGVAPNAISFVASTGTLTVPAAVIGSLTIANVGSGIFGGLYKSSNSNAHLELDTAGIRMYNSSAVKTFDAVASTGALDLTGTLTVGSGGKIRFGDSAADYLDNNILHFEVGTGETGVAEFKNGSNTPYGQLAGLAASTYGEVRVQGFYTSSRAGTLQVLGTSTYGSAVITGAYDASHSAKADAFVQSTSSQLTIQGVSTQGTTSVVALADDTAATSSINFTVNGSLVGSWVSTNRALSLYGRLYPGSGSGTQTSRYIYDNGTEIEFAGGSVHLVSPLKMLSTMRYNSITAAGASGALPNPTKYMQVDNYAGTTAYYIPIYTAPNPWAA